MNIIIFFFGIVHILFVDKYLKNVINEDTYKRNKVYDSEGHTCYISNGVIQELDKITDGRRSGYRITLAPTILVVYILHCRMK